MPPDNWGYVAAAYGVAALLLGLYWRRLVRREADLRARHRRAAPRAARDPAAEPATQAVVVSSPREPQRSPAHPEPGPRGSRR